MSTDEPDRDPRRSDRSATPGALSLGTLTLMAASALLAPESAVAAGPVGPGAPSAPVAAPKTPAPPPVIAPQLPVVTPGPGAANAPMAPSATGPSTATGTKEGLAKDGVTLTINGGPAAVAAPSATTPARETPITIYGSDLKGTTAPSATAAPQSPSPGSR